MYCPILNNTHGYHSNPTLAAPVLCASRPMVLRFHKHIYKVEGEGPWLRRSPPVPTCRPCCIGSRRTVGDAEPLYSSDSHHEQWHHFFHPSAVELHQGQYHQVHL